MKKIMCIVLAVILLGAAVAGVIVWEKTDNSDKKDPSLMDPFLYNR